MIVTATLPHVFKCETASLKNTTNGWTGGGGTGIRWAESGMEGAESGVEGAESGVEGVDGVGSGGRGGGERG